MAKLNDRLNDLQKKKIASFIECTECPDREKAIEYLIRYDWNVDNSALEYLKTVPESKSNGYLGGLYKQISNFFYGVYSYTRSIFSKRSKEEVREGVIAFQKSFGVQCPNFVMHNFAKALKLSRDKRKLLFVYIHDGREKERVNSGYDVHKVISQDVFDFCRTTLTSNVVVKYLNSNFVCWMADINSKDAKMIQKQLRIKNYPFFFTGLSSSRANSWSNIYSHEGKISETNFMSALMDSVNSYQMYLSEKTLKSIAIEDAKLLREQQDYEYNQIAKKDFIKKQEEEKMMIKENEERAKKDMLLKKRDEEIKQIKKSLPKEPSEDEEGVVTFIIGLPDGSSINRRFFKANSIKQLFAFVESIGIQKNSSEPEKRGNFKILSTFPRREYQNNDDTLKEVGFQDREKLIVEFC